jgi:ligand-binding sensor domain-containing protein
MKEKIFFVFIITAVLLIANSCDKQVFTGLVENEVFQYSKIFIDSDPPNSRIFVDGKNMGLVTPDTVKWLDEGAHNFVLKNEYFIDTVFTVSSKLNSTTNFKIDYHGNKQNYGRMEFRTTPTNASIYINGVKNAQVSDIIITNLFAGKYKVKLTLPEHRDDSLETIVYGGKLTRVYRTLEDTSQWVIYNTTNTNIPSNKINCIHVDKNNYKWIGTDNGLLKHDNKKFEIVTAVNSVLSDKNIVCLASDSQNNIWIGTASGLFKYDGSGIQNFTSNLPSSKINDLEFRNGSLWIATNNGLVQYNGSSWNVFNPENSDIQATVITSISSSSAGDIWIGTEKFGIMKFSNNVWTNYNMDNMQLSLKAGNTINDITVDADGNVWVAHRFLPAQYEADNEYGGLTKFDGSKWTYIPISGIAQEQINKLTADANKNIWISTKSGLGKFSNDYLIRFLTSNSKLPNPIVSDAVVDKNENLWIATLGGGFAKVKKGNY